MQNDRIDNLTRDLKLAVFEIKELKTENQGLSNKINEFEAKVMQTHITECIDSTTQTVQHTSAECMVLPKHTHAEVPFPLKTPFSVQEPTHIPIKNRFDVLGKPQKSCFPEPTVPVPDMPARHCRTPREEGQERNTTSTASRQSVTMRNGEARHNMSDITIITDGQSRNIVKRNLFQRKRVYLKTLSKWGTYPEARAYIKGAKHEAKNVLFFLGSKDLQHKPATVVGEAVRNLLVDTKRVWPNAKIILSTVSPATNIFEIERRTLNEFLRHIVSQHVDVYLVDFGNDISFTNEYRRLEQHIKSVITPILEMANA